jgi:VRR-NUC domain
MIRPTLHEHHLEDFAAARFAEAGHVCMKFVSPGFPGVPDRIVLTSTGRVLFIEFKAPGAKPRRTQPAVIRMLREMGHRVEIVDTFAQIDKLLREVGR